MSSIDESPNHGLFPKGGDSWCKYQKAKESGQPFSHKNSLPYTIVEEIKPIFRDLTNIELLKKCLHGRTQNPNECINSIIWARLPKTVFVSISTLHFGVYDAVITFNYGNMSRCKVLQRLLKTVGLSTVKAMYKMDKERLRAADKYAKDIEMKARQHRSAKRKLVEIWKRMLTTHLMDQECIEKLQRSFPKRLKLHPYKIQLLHAINPQEKLLWTQFAATMLQRIGDEPEFLENILFSDEATFHVNGCVNWHSCVIWSLENPLVLHEHTRDFPKVNT
ncbi:hypothetical protein ANN_03092 [Periplaneta americana]|uniref:Uncharacterized protein n=1 Tax=Periplaneta americana TaxID=6978 RepID=A0ABQ8U0Q1_PERAM|nr:hypothetical protein ANN_03092 [Periplaneta americana]